ncbi:MAG TPA: pseudouridine synthase [Nitrospiraceae bacterium]|jgi:23S rRNA pseudouridine2605 synthase|nr:pseudouridine synthase [Nitrospiraceae bacterium]
MEQRLQKILAQAGIASRRLAEGLILEGRVTVNGEIAVIGRKTDPSQDYIKVDGKLISGPMLKGPGSVYLMFHKPRGVVTTLRDPEGRPAITDFLGGIKYRVFPVGRLDYYSDGLLLLTNDGDFANAILHPSRKIPKTYLLKIKGAVDEKSIGELRRGVKLEDGWTMPAKVKRIKESENNSWIEITIYEGKKRQVRRMLEKVGHPVIKLKRTAINGLKLRDLKPGEIRHLTHEELSVIRKEIGIERQSMVSNRQQKKK